MNPPDFFRSLVAICTLGLAAWASPAAAQTLQPDAFDFGNLAVGEVSPEQAFLFSNTTPGALLFESVELQAGDADQFVITDNECVGAIPAAGSCEIRVAFAPTSPGAKSATLHLSYSDPNGAVLRTEAQLSGNGEVPDVEEADLSIQLGVDPPETTPGGALVLSVDIENLGPDAAVALVVDIVFPDGATGIDGNGAGWTCNVVALTLSCTRASLAALAAAPLAVQFDAPVAVGQYEIAGAIASDTFDPVLSNNQDLIQFGVAGAEEADLAIQLDLDQVETTPGGALALSVDVSNLGPDAAGNVVADIVFPDGTTDIDAGGEGWVCNVIALNLTCTRPTLPASATAPLNVQFNAPTAPGQYDIGGAVASDTFDPAPANNQDMVQFAVVEEPAPPPQAAALHVPTLDRAAMLALIVCTLMIGWRMRSR